MGDYTVPADVLAMKPKGSMVKRIKGNYYVYSHSQAKDETTGKWKTSPGKYMGKIVPGVGFCPAGTSSSGRAITVFDYGEYLAACSLSSCDYSLLKAMLNPEESMQVFSLAAIFATQGFVGLKAAASLYERSLMARDYPALGFTYGGIAKLLELLGRQGRTEDFSRLCSSGARTVAVDGHVIPTRSEENDLASPGSETAETGSDYMNLMVALDLDCGMPVATKAFPGYMLDKKDFIEFTESMGGVKGKVIVADMGFSSRENLDYAEENGGWYVTPVQRSREDFKKMSKGRKGRLAGFTYAKGGKADAVEWKREGKLIYYKNLAEAERLSLAYLQGIESGKPGFSKTGYAAQKAGFGVTVLESNLLLGAKEIYELYKRRWAIEVLYDRLKNGIHFEALGLDDYATSQGLALVILVAARIDARILDAAKKAKTTRRGLITLLSYLKLVDDGKKASIRNIKKEHSLVAAKIGIELNPSKKCLG